MRKLTSYVFRISDILFVLVIVLLFARYVSHNWNYYIDDSFITFRYAHNLAEGYGLVFNAGEKYFGSTAMGYAILLGFFSKAIAWLSGIAVFININSLTTKEIIPHLSTIFSAISITSICFIWFKIYRKYLNPISALIFTSFICIYLFDSGPTNFVSGHETYPFVALLFLGSYLGIFQKQPVWCGLFLSLATMVRPDGFLFLLILVTIFLLSILNRTKAIFTCAIVKIIIGYFSAIIVWVIFLWVYFGEFLPGTMVSKKAQIILGFVEFSIQKAVAELSDPNRLYPSLIIVVILGSIFALRYLIPIGKCNLYNCKDDGKIDLVVYSIIWGAFAIASIVAYHMFKVSFWWWYIYPTHFSIVFLVIPSMIIMAFETQKIQKYCKWVPVILIFTFIAIMDGNRYIWHLNNWLINDNNNTHIYSYNDVIDCIQKLEPDGTSIAVSEPGNIGYNLGPKFYIIDLLGLTSPGVSQAIIDGDLDYPFTHWQPKYIIISWAGRYTPENRAWFSDKYEEIGEFNNEHWQQKLGHGAYLYRQIR